MRFSAASLASVLVVLSGCSAANDSASTDSDNALTSSADADRKTAFEHVKGALAQEARGAGSIKTISVTVDASTDPSVITRIVPPKNMNPDCATATNADGQPCIARGRTPASLEGVYWMRGNPLPDYLLSFANSHWTTTDSGVPYGYLPTFAPGSFGWKEKIAAKGAAQNDFKYVPEICRVPKDDPALDLIAHHKSTYDASRFRRPIAEDLAEFAKSGAADAVSDEDIAKFKDGVQAAGQLPLDGDQSVRLLAAGKLFYEAKFNPAYTESSVIVFGLVNGPNVPPAQIGIPEAIASFSLAPHTSDANIFLRKSFIEGLSKSPNYYLLTRIVDGEGRATPYYKDFLQCVQERSEGRILQVAFTK